jgi:hypothetical protein
MHFRLAIMHMQASLWSMIWRVIHQRVLLLERSALAREILRFALDDGKK